MVYFQNQDCPCLPISSKGFDRFCPSLVSLSVEAVTRKCSVKKVLLEISQNSLENTCARVSFFNKVAGLKVALVIAKKSSDF